MKRCIAKMLKGFPVGLLFAQALDWFGNIPGIPVSPQPLPAEWQGWEGNAIGGLGTTVVPNSGGYITVGGGVNYGPNGEISFTNVATVTGISSNNAGSALVPSPGNFTFTASSSPGQANG